jgi:hypothetical protein
LDDFWGSMVGTRLTCLPPGESSCRRCLASTSRNHGTHRIHGKHDIKVLVLVIRLSNTSRGTNSLDDLLTLDGVALRK